MVGGFRTIQTRLDRALAIEEWRLLYPEASVIHLPCVYFDHCPILLKAAKYTTQMMCKPFCFEAA